MTSSPIHIIAHYRGDLDGLSCHAIAHRWFNLHEGNKNYSSIIHHDIRYGLENKPFEQVPHSDDILFCDIGFNNGANFNKAIQKIHELKKSGSNIKFFDHHVWPKYLLESLFDETYHNIKSSSAPLLNKYLNPSSDVVAKHIARLAYMDDRNRQDPTITTLNDLLNAEGYYDPMKLIEHLGTTTSKDQLIPEDAQDTLTIYRKDFNDAIQQLRDSYETRAINSTQINSGLASKLLFMKPGHRTMREDFKQGINLCFFEGLANVMFRSESQEQFERIINSPYAGGGRDLEGGFTLPQVTTKENYQSTLDEVIHNLKL